MRNVNPPSEKGKIIPIRGVAASTDPENDLESDDMETEHDRLRDVEKSLQTTREQMIAGFGDVKTTIAKTETIIIKEVGSAKEAMAKTETAIVKSSTNKTFLAMGIVIAVIAIAVTILIAVL